MGLKQSKTTEKSIAEKFTQSNCRANLDSLRGFDFPFENLVMEGGGTKGIAYCGAIKVLEDLGLMNQIRRVAGTSAGALTATLVAVGYTSDEIIQILETDLQPLFLESSWLCLLPNLLRNYGWQKMNKYSKLMKKLLEKKTGNPNITFGEIYEKYNMELCIVVTNVTTMSTGYCHPKTTPNFPVWKAARMSMSIPGLMTPYKYVNDEVTYYCVDGGVVCNYPLRAFDGWWLSMKPEDSYLMKMTDDARQCSSQTVREWQFGEVNPKTLGLLLFSGDETEYQKNTLLERSGYKMISRPSSKLSRSRGKHIDSILTKMERESLVFDAAKKFVTKAKELKLLQGRYEGVITLKEVDMILQDKNFMKSDVETLFGNGDHNAEHIVEILTGEKGRKEISFDQFKHYLMRKGVNLQAYLEGSPGEQKISSLSGFLSAILSTLDMNEKMQQLAVGDIERTIGIYSDYLSTTDFDMETQDKDFLIRQGIIATVKYLYYYKEKRSREMVEVLKNSAETVV